MTFARLLPFIAFLLVTAPVTAQPVRPFTLTELRTAQAHGQSVLVDVYAPWCPTCRAQAPVIDAIAKDPAFGALVILRVDYDSQPIEKKVLGVSKQATLIAYHGTRETGRVLGATDPAKLKALAASALH